GGYDRAAEAPCELFGDHRLARRGRAEDADDGQAATVLRAACCVPRSVVDVAASMRTSTSSPGAAAPAKLTVVFLRVRPRSSDGSVRLAPSASTSSTPPTRSAFPPAAIRCTPSPRPSSPPCFTSSPPPSLPPPP